MNITEIKNPEEKILMAREILSALPNWFGIPESTEEYIKEGSKMPFFLAEYEEKPVGYITIKENSKFTCEIYVMGVLSDYHKMGIGRALFNRVFEFASEMGYEFIQVKTLDESHADIYYARTRKFYEAMGFKPLEVIPEIWGKENPCLILIQNIKKVYH